MDHNGFPRFPLYRLAWEMELKIEAARKERKANDGNEGRKPAPERTA